ncbi:DUF1566 domain-containing protein [Alkalimonas sp.]|uniref:Lcl domain-containing protein n=1 Tax=Alkalimonas sp. TaxID=1872453 RepID=UPI00263B95E6|nr:DUF1566 domain-containing protein [Alkalimonas sp.]MCC5827524.1 DUF1566 domain-containing protein [Alkalimonas sp.]
MHNITTHSRAIAKASLVATFSTFLVACGSGSGDSGSGGSTPQSFTVSTTVGIGGSISPANRSVQSGRATTFTVTADTGYSIGNVSGCSGSLSGNTYTTGVVTSACTVSASFVVTLAAPENLIVTPGDAHLSFSWDGVADATSYNLYYDTVPNIAPVNYAASNTGVMVQNITSPYTLSGLTNGTSYYAVVTAVVNNAESLASNEVSATPESSFVAIGGLNDTGIDWCANIGINNLDCPVADFPGQDGEFGRDADARAGTLSKIGSGAAGFDYSKIGADGKVLALQNVAWDENGTEADGSQWSCVRDNVTGLIWEVKQAAGSGELRDTNHTYTWYNTDSSMNGGNAGTQNGGTCVGSDCDTQGFVSAVNDQGLCGANDWRIPSVSELLSTVNYGYAYPMIDSNYFPNIAPHWFSSQYWSSTPFANNSSSVWIVPYRFGLYLGSKNEDVHVRLVRAGQ